MKTYNNIPPQELSGFIISVKDVQYEKRFQCKSSCAISQAILNGREKSCDYCVIPTIKGSFVCTEVVITILATTSIKAEWYTANDEVQIVATNGYAYSGKLLCKIVDDERLRLGPYEYIAARSKADLVFTFPPLPDGERIQAVLVRDFRKSNTIRFDLIESSPDDDEYNIEVFRRANELRAVPSRDEVITSVPNNAGAQGGASIIQRNFAYNLNQLKVLIFQRINSRLTSSEIIKLEDKIETKIYSLGLDFDNQKNYGECNVDEEFKDYQKTTIEYREALTEKRRVEGLSDHDLHRVSDLLRINPYDFENLCSSIMKDLGYSNIIVTPRSNDKGIDIIGEINGEKVVAQCKRYKNSVGSPDMQMFIGAMHNANAASGIYFTTASFSKEAETMARSNSIILFGKEKIAEHLSLFDDYDDLKPHFEDWE